MVVVNEHGEHPITQVEDPFFSPPIQTYDWSDTSSVYAEMRTLESAELHALRSNYFREHVLNDDYDILEMNQSGESVFTFQVDLRASVEFVSVPYAMRIAADATIIAVLKYIGKAIKDVSVWSTKGTYQYREPIQPGKRVEGIIRFSPKASMASGSKLIASISLDGSRFTMVTEVVV